jgi:hypothetical protein
VNFFVEFDSQVELARAYEKPLKDSVDATVEGWFPNPYNDSEEIFAARVGRHVYPRDASVIVTVAFGLSTECGLCRHSQEQLDQVAGAVAELFDTRAAALA